jgi:hypothetical protein
MSSFNRNSRNLTIEQQRLLSMNISQYEQISTHIDLLYNMLDEIRGNIIQITQNTNNRRSNVNNSLFSQILNNRYNFVNYDYERPNNSYLNYTNMYRNRNANANNELYSLLSNYLNTSVIVRPTPEQIQNASVLVRYDSIENPSAEYCPISLDEFNDDDQVRQIIHCGHIFHQNSFQQWFARNSRCPICRYDIRNYSNTSSGNTNSEQTSEQNTSRQTRTEETSSTQPISNVQLSRNTDSNQFDHLTFDINEQEFTNNFLDIFARNLLQTMSNPQSNDRYMVDSSNNILIYETILRPRNTSSNYTYMADPSNNNNS